MSKFTQKQLYEKINYDFLPYSTRLKLDYYFNLKSHNNKELINNEELDAWRDFGNRYYGGK